MTAVAVTGRPPARTEVLQWLTPSPLWDLEPLGAGAAGLTQPWIAELTSDTFVDDFLAILAARGSSSPADLETTRPATTVGGSSPGLPGTYRLFQPLSQRYYLVTATLVCRRPGIPDHQLQPARGERTFFVMRRVTSGGGEEAFVPGPGGGTWVVATGGALSAGEQEHPMHPAPVAPFAQAGTTTAALGLGADGGAGRTVHFGYIPVGQRDRLVQPMDDPAQALADLQATMPLPNPPESPSLNELLQRVVTPWSRLLKPPAPPNIAFASLFLILDLSAWLLTHLAPLHQAIVAGTAAAEPKQEALRQRLGLVQVPVSTGGTRSLTSAIAELVPCLPLVDGVDAADPPRAYDLRAASLPGDWLAPPTTATSLAGLASAALAASPATPVLPPELEGLIRNDPVATAGTAAGGGTTYVIRTVLVHHPCQPVLSAPTNPFELARALDPDAPARKILLQMPEITKLRSYQRGVAIEMSPSLRRLMDRVTPEMMKGDGLGSDPGLQLGMICSFSLQIIFLVAFIVMFIFLILLNIIFWWLPFLKICFPIPVKPTSPPGPTP